MAANQSMPFSLEAISLDAHSVTTTSLSPTGEGARRNTRRRVWSPTRTAWCRFIGISRTAAVIAMATTVLAADSFRVGIRVDAAKTKGELKPIWRFFGADEPNYAYMKHGKKLLAELRELAPKQVYFRTHNLLTSGDGTPALKWGSTGAYSEDAKGKAVYNWTILDRIFDTYLEGGVRPYAQIGFMPRELSVKPEPYQHHWNPRLGYNEIFTGWACPP